MASRAPQGPGVGLWPRPDERGCGAMPGPQAGIERAETAAKGGRRDAPEGGFNRLCRGPTRRRQTLGANGVMGRAAGRVEYCEILRGFAVIAGRRTQAGAALAKNKDAGCVSGDSLA